MVDKKKKSDWKKLQEELKEIEARPGKTWTQAYRDEKKRSEQTVTYETRRPTLTRAILTGPIVAFFWRKKETKKAKIN